MKNACLCLFIPYLLLISLGSLAQETKPPTSITNKIEKYYTLFPSEKVYLSFDKPYYTIGDTLWFKSILLNSDHSVNTRSDKLYVELFNDSSQLVERRVVGLDNGLGFGQFPLSQKLTDGSYSIRAYTNWQQNFGVDAYFLKNFYIGNASNKTWLITSNQKITTENGKRSLNIKASLTNLRNEPSGYLDLEIYLMNGNKKVMHTELQTDQGGVFDAKLPLPTDNLNSNYSFLITDKKDKLRRAILPLILNDLAEIDLQFMPEGGYLVAGIYNKVAFKAVAATGLGRNVTGKIVNSKNEQLTTFASQHQGMGNFFLLPQKGETYAAVFNVNGKEQKVPLPSVQAEGTTLRIDHTSQPDSLYVFIRASEGKRIDQEYELVAQAADSLIFASRINLKNGFSNLKLAKNGFPDGIVHFTLFSPDQQPLNERNTFINLKQQIKLSVTQGTSSKPKDSISLSIHATDENNNPIKGTFSIAITDNAQVKLPVNGDNIATYFLLQSNLKGNIEDADWYFRNQDGEARIALDNLLLTQGWIGYNWSEVLKKQASPKFIAENGNKIIGRLTNLLNKPVPEMRLTLLSLGKDILVTDTISNLDGGFTFSNLPRLDSASYAIKIKNATGKASAAKISVNEFVPPLPIGLAEKTNPWYVNSDSTALKHFLNGKEKVKQNETIMSPLTGTTLKEVEIKGVNPNIAYEVAWDAKIYKSITEEELKKTPRKTLLNLLTERFSGFKISDRWYPNCSTGAERFLFEEYVIGLNIINSIRIDKISTTKVSAIGGPQAWFEVNKQLFNYLSAEDIKSIQLYKGCAFYYLEITTRSGNGPWVAASQGNYVYRPLPLSPAKEFYSPKYTTESKNDLPDLRSTIYWNAHVITDENGKAKVSFYAADKPSTYTVKAEGTDLMGRFGYQKTIIQVADKPKSK